MAWTLEVLFQFFAASCCSCWVTTFEWRVESLVALQCVFLEFVVVFHCKNFSFLPGLLAGVQFASSVLKGSRDSSNTVVINLFSYPPQSHFHAFGIPSLILQALCRFILISAVVHSSLKKPNKQAHATGDPAYRKDDDIELRKQPLTAVTGFGLSGQGSHVKANTYSMFLEAPFFFFFF